MSLHFKIKEILHPKIEIFEDLLYESIFQASTADKLPKNIIYTPELYLYIKDFGKEGDYFLAAEEENNNICGGVWVRILSEEIKGYGNIDAATPEFAIAVFSKYRKHGIGTALMKSMILLLKQKGYKQASLSVHKNNYAFGIYKSLGFQIINEREKDYLMVLKLK